MPAGEISQDVVNTFVIAAHGDLLRRRGAREDAG